MRIIGQTGNDDVALVYLAEMGHDRLVEFVESIQPPLPRKHKWVLLISTMAGCPVSCLMCDAGGSFKGLLSRNEMLSQIDYIVMKRFPDRVIPCKQFKIQLSRMGEPALNPAVNDVIRELPVRYNAPGLIPSLSTIAPAGKRLFFEEMLAIKNALYLNGHFQLQFSIHSTDKRVKDWLIPVKTWTFKDISTYGNRFHQTGDRKITLNFALAENIPVAPGTINEWFDPEKFLIKLTPLNPTYRSQENGLLSRLVSLTEHGIADLQEEFQLLGYEVIVSIGNTVENLIGSNCGQYVRRHLAADTPLMNAYTYSIRETNQKQVSGS